jgi:hypothetical protein
MRFSNAQLVPLPKLSQTIEFSNYHNTRWRFLKPSNHIFMIYPNISKTPLDQPSKQQETKNQNTIVNKVI